MKVAFRSLVGYREKEIDLLMDFSTLEAVGRGLGIDFWEIAESLKDNSEAFARELLYQAYVTATKERLLAAKRRGRIAFWAELRRPIYTRSHAGIWYEMLSKQSTEEFTGLMMDLFGRITKEDKDLKKKVKEKK